MWDPTQDVDMSRPPIPMIISSSELRPSGFKIQEVLPPTLEGAARGGLLRRGAGLRSLEGMVPKRFVLSVDDDTKKKNRGPHRPPSMMRLKTLFQL